MGRLPFAHKVYVRRGLIVVGSLLLLLSFGWITGLLLAVDHFFDDRQQLLTSLTAVGTAVGALGAGFAAVFAAVQIFEQRRIAGFASSRDTLWRMSDAYAALADARAKWQGYKDPTALEDLLDFFESLAYLANGGHIDDEMSWAWFYAAAKPVWSDDTAKAFVASKRTIEQTVWMEIGPWLDRLDVIEQRKAAELKSAGNAGG